MRPPSIVGLYLELGAGAAPEASVADNPILLTSFASHRSADPSSVSSRAREVLAGTIL